MDNDYSSGANPELTRALGRERFTWKSKDGTRSVEYGRPNGPIFSRVARVLGSQSGNQALQMLYRAFMHIKSRSFTDASGESKTEPVGDLGAPLRTDDHFFAMEQWFGSEDNLNSFLQDMDKNLYPDVVEALADAQATGESDDSMVRIHENASALYTKV